MCITWYTSFKILFSEQGDEHIMYDISIQAGEILTNKNMFDGSKILKKFDEKTFEYQMPTIFVSAGKGPQGGIIETHFKGQCFELPKCKFFKKIKLFICLGVNGKSGFLIEKELVHHQQEQMMWMARRIQELEEKMTDEQVNSKQVFINLHSV